MKYLLWLPFLLFSFTLSAQSISKSELQQFNQERLQISKKGMLFLGAWGVANIATSAIGYASTGSEVDKNFHQMNLFWGGINFGLAAVGYLGAVKDKKEYDLEQTVKQQHGIEKTFLANAALDAVYVTAGLYLKERSKNETKNKARFDGYGQSIMLQGAFLLCFDGVMYAIESRHGNRKLSPLLNRIQLSSNGMGLRYQF